MSVSQPQNNDEEIRKREAEAAVRQKALMLLLDTNARQRLMNIRIV
jgi:DNA-binding TFAR19-related protein (PDSD5 family)